MIVRLGGWAHPMLGNQSFVEKILFPALEDLLSFFTLPALYHFHNTLYTPLNLPPRPMSHLNQDECGESRLVTAISSILS